MKCPYCKKTFDNPISVAGGKIGGKARVAKGFSVAGQPTAEARLKGWQTRKLNAKKQRGV